MAQVRKEVVESVRSRLEEDQVRLRKECDRRKYEMRRLQEQMAKLVHKQTVAKRTVAELGALLKTLPVYKK